MSRRRKTIRQLLILAAGAAVGAFWLSVDSPPFAAGQAQAPQAIRTAPQTHSLTKMGVRGPGGQSRPSARPASISPPAKAARPGRYVVRTMRVTAYCPCRICCGRWSDGATASGKPVTANAGRFVAAPKTLPFRTMLTVPGYDGDRPVPVLDRGGAIQGDRLDVFFPTHQQALQWGVRNLEVKIFHRHRHRRRP